MLIGKSIIMFSVGIVGLAALVFAHFALDFQPITDKRTTQSFVSIQATPSASVTQTPVKTNTKPQVYTPTVQNNPVIDCIGPDGKHLQVTQKVCDDFNGSWGNKKSGNTNQNQSGQDLVSIPCNTVMGSFIAYGTSGTDASNNCIEAMNDAINAKAGLSATSNSPAVQITPSPTPPPVDNTQQLCVQRAQVQYNSNLNNCPPLPAPMSNQGCLDQAAKQYQYDMAKCGVGSYPTR